MRVVTVENFGKRPPDSTGGKGYIYEGDCWLLRFQIASEEHFFRDEIRNLANNVFNIDPRQIMRLVLYGKPGVGLFDARVYISFEYPPQQSQMDSLRVEVESSATDNSGDKLDDLFLEFLKDANSSIIKRLARSLDHPVGASATVKKGGRRNVTYGNYVFCEENGKFQCGNVFRLHWEDDSTDHLAHWNNANFLLSEALREKYSPQNIVRFELRGIPDTEDGYSMEAEVLVEGPLRPYPIRITPRRRKSLEKSRTRPPTAAKDGVVEFVPGQAPYSGLNKAGRSLADRLRQLPLEARVVFWQEHIARFFM